MGKKSGSGSRIRIRDGKPGSYFLEPRSHFFQLKNLNSLMRIRDPGSEMEKIQIRDLGSRMEKIWIQNPGSGMEKIRIRDPGSGINIPVQQNWKSRRQICQDLKNRVKIKPFVEKAFQDKTKSFLQSKAASVALKRGKTPVNWIFQSPTRHGRHCRTMSPGAKLLLQLTL